KTWWLAAAWVTSPIRQLGGVGGTVAGLPASAHATTGATSSMLLAGMVLWAGLDPGQAAPPVPAQAELALWNCAVSDHPTSVTGLMFPCEVCTFPFSMMAFIVTPAGRPPGTVGSISVIPRGSGFTVWVTTCWIPGGAA